MKKVTTPINYHAHHRRQLVPLFRRVILTGITLLLVGLTLLLFGSEWLYQSLSRGRENQTYVFPSPEAGRVLLIHANAELKQSQAILLEGNLQIELIGGYGSYPLGSVWPLLTLDQRPIEFVRSVYSFIFHQPVAAVITLSLPQSKISNWALQLTIWQKMTAFSTGWAQRRELLLTSLVLRQHPITTARSLTHPDEILSLVEREHSAFKNQARECGLAILNASDLTGLANQFRQVIEYNQGYVVRVDDATSQLPTTMLVIDQQKQTECDQTATLIELLIPLPITITRAQDVYTTYRTPLALLLGEDVAAVFKK